MNTPDPKKSSPSTPPSQGIHHPVPLDDLVQMVLESYREEKKLSHLDSIFLPNRARTVNMLEMLRRLCFPGFFDHGKLTTHMVQYHVGEQLTQIRDAIYHEVRQALRYHQNRHSGTPSNEDCTDCDHEAHRITDVFLQRIPAVRHKLAMDIQAGFDGDPAAASTDEIVFCYPGLDAIFIHRIAHEFFKLNVPLLPRIMSEYAHNETGIDIHPGATIGESFFIDHGTGIVIGETCVIGNRVKIYQGVTLGALSTKGGQAWRGRRRHPTLEDDVTIYAGAVILGGETTIGKGATIGGSVFITSSIPAGYTVTVKPPELKLSAKKSRPSDNDFIGDFII